VLEGRRITAVSPFPGFSREAQLVQSGLEWISLRASTFIPEGYRLILDHHPAPDGSVLRRRRGDVRSGGKAAELEVSALPHVRPGRADLSGREPAEVAAD